MRGLDALHDGAEEGPAGPAQVEGQWGWVVRDALAIVEDADVDVVVDDGHVRPALGGDLIGHNFKRKQ